MSQNAAESAAHANAMQEAAFHVEAHVATMLRNFVQEAGTTDPQVLAFVESVTRIVAQARFSGTVISQRATYIMDNGRYKTFVRLSIPKVEVNRNVVNHIRNERAAYEEWKASQAFQEMDRQIEKNW